MIKIVIGQLLREKIIKDSSFFQTKIPLLTYYRKSHTESGGTVTQLGSGFVLSFVYEDSLSNYFNSKLLIMKVKIFDNLFCAVIPPDEFYSNEFFIDIVNGKISIID